MKRIFFLILLVHGSGFLLSAATLIPGSELGFSGVSFDYSRIRFNSTTGESGASASLSGDDLILNFGAFGGSAASAGFAQDYGTGFIGFRVQAVDSFIQDLNITAQGTYQLQAPNSGSWASIFGSIPFTMQVLGVNGIPYRGTNSTLTDSITLNPSSISIQNPNGASNQSNQTIPSSGIWSGQWSLASVASTLAGIFHLAEGQKVTELEVSVTPDISTAAGGGGSGVVTLGQVKFAPTPEPSSLTMLGVAGWALWASRRRRA